MPIVDFGGSSSSSMLTYEAIYRQFLIFWFPADDSNLQQNEEKNALLLKPVSGRGGSTENSVSVVLGSSAYQIL